MEQNIKYQKTHNACTVRTSIAVDAATRDRLAAAKPEWLNWDAYLSLLHDHTDWRALAEDLDHRYAAYEAEAVATARQRLLEARRRPERLLTADQAREQILARRMERFEEALRTAIEHVGRDGSTRSAIADRLAEQAEALRSD